MNKKPLTQDEVFWLASHTHNTLQPLIAAAQQYDPSLRLTIEMKFVGATEHILAGSVSAVIWHDTPSISLFASTQLMRDKAELKKVAAKLQTFIDTEQAILEAKHDVEALYAIEQADIAAAQGWEWQQERNRERADIERDEDARDMYEQNVAAGN